MTGLRRLNRSMAVARTIPAFGAAVGLGSGRRLHRTRRRNTEPQAMQKPTAKSDARLMRRIGEGEQEPYRLLVDTYLDRIVTYSYRMLGDSAEAEDVAQEAFLRLWRQAAKWRADAPVIHWLHRVAYNLCIDRLRRKPGVGLDAIAEPADPARSAARALHEGQLARAVDAAIAALPERQRAAVALVHQEGLSNIETAEIMGISVEAVESLLARGRRHLKASLAALRPDLEGEI